MNDVVKRRIHMNQDKMDYMKKEYGDTYLSKFGMMVLSGYTIQEAIDACWKIYKPKEETEK